MLRSSGTLNPEHSGTSNTLGTPDTPAPTGYLGGSADAESSEDDVDHALGGQDVAPHHSGLGRGVQDGALGDHHPHGGQAALGGGQGTFRSPPETLPTAAAPRDPPTFLPRGSRDTRPPPPTHMPRDQGPRTPLSQGTGVPDHPPSREQRLRNPHPKRLGSRDPTHQGIQVSGPPTPRDCGPRPPSRQLRSQNPSPEEIGVPESPTPSPSTPTASIALAPQSGGPSSSGCPGGGVSPQPCVAPVVGPSSWGWLMGGATALGCPSWGVPHPGSALREGLAAWGCSSWGSITHGGAPWEGPSAQGCPSRGVPGVGGSMPTWLRGMSWPTMQRRQ